MDWCSCHPTELATCFFHDSPQASVLLCLYAIRSSGCSGVRWPVVAATQKFEIVCTPRGVPLTQALNFHILEEAGP